MTKLTDAIRYFANAPKNIHCNKKAQTQQHATTTLPAVTICTTSALCTTPSTNKPSHQSLSVPPQHSALPLPPTNPPSSHYLYHLSTLQYPSHQQTLPPVTTCTNSALHYPPTNTHTLPLCTCTLRSSHCSPYLCLSDVSKLFSVPTHCTVTRSAQQWGTSQCRASNHKNIFPFPR